MTMRCHNCGEDVDGGLGIVALVVAFALGGVALYGLIQFWEFARRILF